MDFQTILPSVVVSVIFAMLSGYVVVNGEVKALEAKQEEIINRQVRQNDQLRDEIRELRQEQNEILRWLRDNN